MVVDMPEPLFQAELDSVRPLLTMLKAMQIKGYITCTIESEVMTFVAQDMHSIKATAYMQREHFSRYRYTGSDDSPRFTVGLDALIGCLGIIASNSNDACKMKYVGEGAVFEIRGENREAIEICRLKTMEPEEEIIGLTMGQEVSWLQSTLMKSDWFKDALSDLDSTCESVTFHISPDDQFFRLTANGESGEWNMEYPARSDAFLEFHAEAEVKFSYRYSHIVLCKKALEMSEHVSLRTDPYGYLGLLFSVETSSKAAYVEFIIAPLDTDEMSTQSDSGT
ncbi:Rad1/Rec1/Rad17 [Umbelopsis sp. PMI_123]|nr:Rad1/Rec1/Rad17 [Umbelopsis sp. PMI_123]